MPRPAAVRHRASSRWRSLSDRARVSRSAVRAARWSRFVSLALAQRPGPGFPVGSSGRPLVALRLAGARSATGPGFPGRQFGPPVGRASSRWRSLSDRGLGIRSLSERGTSETKRGPGCSSAGGPWVALRLAGARSATGPRFPGVERARHERDETRLGPSVSGRGRAASPRRRGPGVRRRGRRSGSR